MNAADRVTESDEPAADDVGADAVSAPDEPLRARWRPAAGSPGSASAKARYGRDGRPRGLLRRLTAIYGWRLYAVPVLLALTVLVVVDTVSASGVPEESGGADGGSAPAAATDGAPDTPLATEHRLDGAPPKGGTAQLPAGGDFTKKGKGSWHIIPGTSDAVGKGKPVLTYTVEVEKGIDPSSYAGNKAFAQTVEATLSDPRSWVGSGEVSLKRVDADGPPPDFRVRLTTPKTILGPCGGPIDFPVSCYEPTQDSGVYINLARWVRGALAFDGDIGLYRQYAINHEVGHALGNDHQYCHEDGALAPVMMQQTFGVSNDYVAEISSSAPANGKVCRPSAWPNPENEPAE